MWNYVWAGNEIKKEENIAVLDKLLKPSITSSKVIYPGQTDTITVELTDYKNRPAENVNFTAVSYNSQFGKDINVEEPPYLKRFKSGRRILIDKYEMDESFFVKHFVLGEHPGWCRLMQLDTMPFYRLLFPKDGFAKAVQPIRELAPQLSVHVVKKGTPQEIYMLYINREFTYYNGVTDKSKYAFSVWPGYTQIGIRLKNKFIEIDSIYLQPYYKYDIVFDMDKLPVHSKITDRPDSYTTEERNEIESHIMQLQNDYRTNNGYIWQGNKSVYIGSDKKHLIGPFSKSDSLQFFKQGDFDLKFSFESGYEYRLSAKMARLERNNIFYQALHKPILLPDVKKTKWILGDTITPPPAIVYNKPVERPYFRVNSYGWYKVVPGQRTGGLKIEKPADSFFIYAVLFEDVYDSSYQIRSSDLFEYNGLTPGKYHLVLVTKNYQYIELSDIEIKPGGKLCIQINPVYAVKNDLIESLPARYAKEDEKRLAENKSVQGKKEIISSPGLPLPAGTGSIEGRIIDAKGKGPIAGATVRIRGYAGGALSLADGSYILKNIKEGDYILDAASVGYESREQRVHINEGQVSFANFNLDVAERNLAEVVVVGYGTKRKANQLSYAFSTVQSKDLTGALMGRIPGVQIDNNNGTPDAADSVQIKIRGNRSISGNSQPFLVVNGVLVPGNTLNDIDPNNIASITTLRGDQATALYGAAAANGALIITTKDFVSGSLRENFRDYAFWVPTMFTDKDGKAKFTVTYPDNITSWQTYVVGMDKKRRFAKGSFLTKSFKPLLAQLATPQFLIEGDSSLFIGKVVNYSENAVSIKSEFKLGGQLIASANKALTANAAVTESFPVFANGTDSIKAQYGITSISGFTDGELRKIPVFRKGIEEAKGNFWTLENDTSFSFTPDANAGEIKIHVQNNTLDLLLEEIKYLKDYPYFCMEQTASKLTGLLMEKEIRSKLNQRFDGGKEMEKLLKKLQESQLYSGGWAWWPGGSANIAVTNYVLEALLLLKNDVLVETNIRNGLLYLQNNLTAMKRNNQLASLYTMSEAGHYMDYTGFLGKLPFDSLTTHQQWQVIKIKQKQKLDYETELGKLMKKKIETMLGGLHWGDDSFYWESNVMATTALAFRFFENEEKYQPLLKQIIQYFLERRQHGRWRNTVESAKITAAILPTVFKQNEDFMLPATLNISGGESISVNKFPFSKTISNTGKPVTVSKSGGGLLYFTAWQQIHNPAPQPVNDRFEITTWFERNGIKTEQLKAGEKAVMKIKVHVLKDADYVQIEIPIPAGCTYTEKKQHSYRAHAEFYKNKQVLFTENMPAGTYVFEIELEPRYSGFYHVNPAKAELMYFPVFYGRNEMKTTEIKN
jgi:TonB-dependent SusC/RagA subfamily outer membrane receptor